MTGHGTRRGSPPGSRAETMPRRRWSVVSAAWAWRRPVASPTKATDDRWRQSVEDGVMGMVRCVRAALPLPRGAKWARIVNFSAHSTQRQSVMLPAYTGAKAMLTLRSSGAHAPGRPARRDRPGGRVPRVAAQLLHDRIQCQRRRRFGLHLNPGWRTKTERGALLRRRPGTPDVVVHQRDRRVPVIDHRRG